jgi:hypothetical protein
MGEKKTGPMTKHIQLKICSEHTVWIIASGGLLFRRSLAGPCHACHATHSTLPLLPRTTMPFAAEAPRAEGTDRPVALTINPSAHTINPNAHPSLSLFANSRWDDEPAPRQRDGKNDKQEKRDRRAAAAAVASDAFEYAASKKKKKKKKKKKVVGKCPLGLSFFFLIFFL